MKPVIIAILVVTAVSVVLYFRGGAPSPSAVHMTTDLLISTGHDDVPTEPIANLHTFSQTFVGRTDGLSSIEFLAATWGALIPSGSITAVVMMPGSPQRAVVVHEIDARSILDNHYVGFDFPPIRGSAGAPLQLLLTPHDLPAGSRFSVWLTRRHVYRQGASFVDGLPTGAGELVMTVSRKAFASEVVKSFCIVWFVSISIAVYLFAIGLAILTMFNSDSVTLLYISPAIGVAVIGALSGVGVITGHVRSVNLVGGAVLLLLAIASLARNRHRFKGLQVPAASIFCCLALITISCAITSQPGEIPLADPRDGPWRSFVPMYPADGLIPYESASIIANKLAARDFMFEPKWQISDRTHLLTLLYLHFCQWFRIVPTHVPVGPWEIVDAYGFWLLRSLAFAANSFVVLGIALVGSAILNRTASRMALAVAVIAPFLILNACYTWPKMLCAYLVMVGIYLLVQRKFALAGALFGLAYWAHPFANLISLGALWFAWAIGADRRASFRNAVRFTVALGLVVGAGGLFNGTVFGVKGESLYLYPLDSGFPYHTTNDPEVVLRDFRATPLWDLFAIRLHNLAVFLFPSEMQNVSLPLHPGEIWDRMKWNWFRICLGSLWGTVGLITFVLTVWGIVLSRAKREMLVLAVAFIAVPALAYILWMGYLSDFNGYTVCQVIVPAAMIFAAVALESFSRVTAIAVVTAVSVEMLFALSIPYHDAAVAAGLTALCAAAVVVTASAARSGNGLVTSGAAHTPKFPR